MSAFKDISYAFQYDITRNGWIRKSCNSNFYGIVMMFHHVTDEYVKINESCKCTINDFKTIIELYRAAGYEYLSMDEAIMVVKNCDKRKFAVVTFDDIPDNVYTNAYPFLKFKNIPFTIFVTADFINSNDFITKEHLLELTNDPLCTIGAHTMTHPLLRQVRNSAWQINQSKKELELMIGKSVKYFAYPFGRYSAISNKVLKETRLAGFDCAFCTIDAPLTEASSKCLFFLPRIVPNSNQIKQFRVEWTFHRIILSLITMPIRLLLRRLKKWCDAGKYE